MAITARARLCARFRWLTAAAVALSAGLAPVGAAFGAEVVPPVGAPDVPPVVIEGREAPVVGPPDGRSDAPPGNDAGLAGAGNDGAAEAAGGADTNNTKQDADDEDDGGTSSDAACAGGATDAAAVAGTNGEDGTDSEDGEWAEDTEATEAAADGCVTPPTSPETEDDTLPADQDEALDSTDAEIALAEIAPAAAITFTPKPGTDRWAGNSRLETATQIATNANLRLATTAFVAYGWDFPDALAAAAAAGKLAAPILLIGDGATGDQAAITFLAENMPNLKTVYILGGVARVTADTEKRITAATRPTGVVVERLAGADRYETAAKIAGRFFAAANEVFLAAGYDGKFPDALAAASLAGNVGAPVLLTDRDQVSPAVIDYLAKLPGAITVNIVGGAASVSDKVAAQITQALDNKQLSFPARIAGAGRYETAELIAQEFEKRIANPNTIFITTGESYPDALAGAPAAAVAQAPVLLTASAFLPTVVRDYVRAHPAITSAIYLGGEATVIKENKDLLQRIMTDRTGFIPVSSVSLSSGFTLDIGKSQKLTATISPNNASYQNLKWTSSNPKVATVSASGAVGEITALSAGTTDIRIAAIDGGFTATAKVTVQKPPPPPNVRTIQSPDGIANIRTGPGAGYAIVGKLNTGDTVTILEVRSGWCRVTGRVSGWVANWLLSPSPNSRLIEAAEWWHAKGARLSEHPKYGGVTWGGHMNYSLHYGGRAVDMNYGPDGENAIEKQFFDSLLPSFRSAFPLVNVQWRVPGHYNHMHIEE